jgi:hypothetical protein
MEIHAPEKPILTVKEAIAHLAIVTVGILIALSLEGLVEWRHHRALVREARDNISAELRDNRADLRTVRGKMDGLLKKLAEAADTVDGLSSQWDESTATALFAAPGPKYVMYNYDLTTLSTASHTTAQTTGALSFMDYSDVERCAHIYELQEMFVRQQTQSADAAQTAAALGLGLVKKPSAADFEAVKRQLRLAAGELLFERGYADVLLKAYDGALNEIK